jgi:hypothetical protein
MHMRPRKISPPSALHRGDDHQTQIWLGSEPPKRIIYFPSDAMFRWWLRLARSDNEAPQHIAAMAHVGQPLRRDIQLLKLLREPANAVVEIFGDVGPDELLLYMTLAGELDSPRRRARHRPVVDYGGMLSRMFALAERDMTNRVLTSLSEPFDERQAELMRFIQKKSPIDLKGLLGPGPAAILESGRTLWLTGLLHQSMSHPRMAWDITRAIRPPTPL